MIFFSVTLLSIENGFAGLRLGALQVENGFVVFLLEALQVNIASRDFD